ncbi:SusC/RagA family TonB-linked outer membrane protein [Pedobacter antarcticus]|uniref:SusC/RagA family TonB-linked outer membrane protein n=1 Tax=Pedobacter antarcticus TaxID=34086 RepID=UPI00088472C3|nr:TonB-dependent receptor [Pedobacter antarcticus]SDL77155.1 TonB-linked outer membrane protein, SusC/RagA family [Pedobacter antarcticus]
MNIKRLLCTGIPVLLLMNNQVFASSAVKSELSFSAISSAYFQGSQQQIRISGTVLDENSQPIPGVGIKSKSGKTTVTDGNGKFTIDVTSATEQLTFTFMGYTPQTRAAGSGSSPLSVKLVPAEGVNLDDVVVVGYGTRRKSDVTGAVGSVKLEQLQERPAASLNQALAGRISGVQVNTNSGRPGGQTSIRIRGFSSISSSNNPLYVIDGVILPVGTQTQRSNAIDFLNPGDIESVEVLKDASSIAIYGARGANGVILITTKKGSSAGSRITYDVDFSVPTIGPKRVEMLNAKEYIDTENLAYDNAKIYDPAGWAAGNYVDPRIKRKSLPLLFDASGNPLYDTDWFKESTQSKLSQNHQLGFTGGNTETTYGIFLNYREDNGLLKGSYLKRYSGRFNVESQVKSWMKVGGSLTYTNQEENLVDIGTGGLNAVRMITESFPFLPVKYPDGTWADNQNYPGAEGGSNPVHILNDRQYILQTQNALANVYANINLAEGLEFRSVLGANVVTRGRNEYNARSLYGIAFDQKGTSYLDNNRESYWSFENYLTYNKKVGKDHNFTGLLGLSWQETNVFGFGAGGENFSTDYFEYNNLGAASKPLPGTSRRSSFAFNSYFGRLNYTFKEKYLLTATGRVDGSSKFGENHKYAFFPSAAVAWKVSEEDFIKGSSTVSNLKLRASYGVTGNSEVNPYTSLSLLGTADYAAIIDNTRIGGIGTNRLANPDLKWEKTAQSDIGIELGLFQNRVNIEADVYYRKTTDMLLAAPVALSSGYATITKNIGSMENKGLEFAINTVNISNENFTWNTSFNISMNRNKVLSLATPADIFGVGNPGFTNETGIIRVGEAVGSFWGLTRLGTWSESERAEAAKYNYRGGKTVQPGDVKYLDVNGDYQINDDDRRIIGNGSPKGWGSFSNSFKYKNLDLTVDIQYSYGNDVLDMSTHSAEDRVGIANSYKSVLNAWTPTNQNTPIAAIRDTRAGYVTNVDSRWVQDGSFIRGRNAVLGYSFPAEVVKRMKLSRLRIYTSVQNFFLATKYRGNDPEVTTYDNAFAQGQTFFDYPKPTTFLLGLNIGL